MTRGHLEELDPGEVRPLWRRCARQVRLLARVDYVTHSHSLFIVAIAIGVGMIPLVADHFFQALPASLAPLLGSGILLAAVAPVLLNLFFNGTARCDEDSRL
jgi:xanthine/uracil permease